MINVLWVRLHQHGYHRCIALYPGDPVGDSQAACGSGRSFAEYTCSLPLDLTRLAMHLEEDQPYVNVF